MWLIALYNFPNSAEESNRRKHLLKTFSHSTDEVGYETNTTSGRLSVRVPYLQGVDLFQFDLTRCQPAEFDNDLHMNSCSV
jgi:hypothetical protein